MAVLGVALVASLALFVVCVLAAASVAYWGARTGVPPFPTTRAERREVLECLREAGVSGGVIYELGCGFGGLARQLARAFPRCRVEAVEISPLVAAWAKLRGARLGNLRVQRGDFMGRDLADARAVVCYLMIDATQALGQKLDRELTPGTPVVSVAFGFRRRVPATVRPTGGWSPGEVRLYRWPAHDRNE